MKINTLLASCLMLISGTVCYAQSSTTALPPVKPLTYGNPIHPFMMCADPTAVEYEGRLYVYGTNDQQEYESVSPGTNNSYGHIKTLVIMSTADMVNWTYHGTIDMAKVCGSWMYASWAPSIVSRVEADGLTHFYMYFSNSGGGVGVITSTSPVGPWTAPLNRSLISGSTPGLGPCSCPFDPGVVIDDEGNGWLAFGGGDPVAGASKLQPGNARIVKLGPDMISLASDIVPIKAPYHFEANELNIIGGKFVYSYCTGWSDRNDWYKYSTTAKAPSTCSICYMVSDNPLDPDSWEWGGEILKDPGQFGYPWGNNHTHLHKFNGSYYMIYHTQVMENIAGIRGGYRSIAVDKAVVDEDTQKISPVNATNAGASQITANRPDALQRQQAETIWNAVGVGSLKEKTDGNMSIGNIEPGGWVAVKNVDFGKEEVNLFTARIRGKGKLEIHIKNATSAPVGVLEFSSSAMKDNTVQLSSPVKGVRNVFFVFPESNSMTRFDEWQFSIGDSDAIVSIDSDCEPLKTEYFTLTGMPVANPEKGMYIKRATFADGHTNVEKIVIF